MSTHSDRLAALRGPKHLRGAPVTGEPTGVRREQDDVRGDPGGVQRLAELGEGADPELVQQGRDPLVVVRARPLGVGVLGREVGRELAGVDALRARLDGL